MGDDEVCPECKGTGWVPDSIDNYVYDPYGMAPCRSCDGSKKRRPPPEIDPADQRSMPAATVSPEDSSTSTKDPVTRESE